MAIYTWIRLPLFHLDMNVDNYTSMEVLDNVLDDYPSRREMIFQNGYLTIKVYDKEFSTYQLDFPNKEVEEGLTKFLVPYYNPISKDQEAFFVMNFVKEVRAGQTETFMKRQEGLSV